MKESENYIKRLSEYKEIFGSTMTIKEIESRVIESFRREKNIAKGTNTIILIYIKPIFTEHDLIEIKDLLSTEDIKFGYFDSSGEIMNSFEIPHIVLYIGKEVAKKLAIKSVSDLIKYVYNKVEGKSIQEITVNSKIDKDVKLEVKIESENSQKICFKFEGSVSESQLDNLILTADKLVNNIERPKPERIEDLEEKYEIDDETKQWKKYNLLEEIKKARMKNE